MQDGEVLYEIPVRNVSERKGQKKTLPPRSGGRDCKSRPAKEKRYPRGAGDGIANPVRLKSDLCRTGFATPSPAPRG
jgi:hypothetical protein